MNATYATAKLVPLAAELDANKVTPGVLGFIVFAALGGAVWVLMKSMNKQLGRVDFEETAPEPAATGSEQPPSGAKASQA